MNGAFRTERAGSERGAIVIQVATGLFVFTLASGFLIDYGILVVSRNEVQNTADSAALAGATALAFDNHVDRSATGPAYVTAQGLAAKNPVWYEAASVEIDPNVVCQSTWEVGPSATPIRACVEVKAFRNAAHRNGIPAYLSKLMGFDFLGVSTVAMAEAKAANFTTCLKPLAVPDRWTEFFPAPPAPWGVGSTFERWDPAGGLRPVRDSYSPPIPTGPGTGLTMNDQFGLAVTLEPGEIAMPIASITAWSYLPVQIPGSVLGPNDVRANTNSCADSRVAFGDRLNFAPGGVAANAPLAAAGLQDLINKDPDARWNAVTRRVDGSCADTPSGLCNGRRFSMSPRIIALAVYDPAGLANDSNAGAATSVVVRNIIGFFIETVAGTNATGRIVRHPGQRDPVNVITLTDNASFLRASLLIK